MMAQLSDTQLAQCARQGDLDAYGELVLRYQNAVFSACYRLLGERREAEDLAQETFLRAYQRLSNYDLQRPFGPWIRRVAANLCLNHMQARLQAAYTLQDPLPEEDEAPTRFLPCERGPELVHEQVETSRAVQQALHSLPVHYRAVIELRHFQDLSYAEIAAALRIPLSDVKSHLFRARKLLAERLDP